jgi:hypothetical protein
MVRRPKMVEHVTTSFRRATVNMPRKALLLVAVWPLVFISAAADSCSQGARAFFIRPFNGAVVASPFKVIFGAEGVDVQAVPAGRVPEDIGHHDLLINLDALPEGAAIPNDEQHLHFDKGETRGEVSLPPGNYTLTLQFADGLERSHGPDMSATIHVTVH